MKRCCQRPLRKPSELCNYLRAPAIQGCQRRRMKHLPLLTHLGNSCLSSWTSTTLATHRKSLVINLLISMLLEQHKEACIYPCTTPGMLLEQHKEACIYPCTTPGMLLEQHKEAVLHLLSEPSLLEEQVNLALKTLQELGVEETDVSDSSDADDTERLEERLFLLVQEMDTVHSNDITGMLLEMDPAALRQMLSDRTMLEGAVQKAQAALESIWIQEDKEITK
ncbi:uncharacterized protein LOC109903761 isoform X5 [Oncorhynchus kisutch]|uniref:uncharacterized protein LOC109903761 isoform X5 n=1 Tax=Oncorhynchus kisutch TaxID=8019 RepID=UPI0012DFC0FC|nr:uncharacterized protein LOC109903761 isoform X5 [Oncorhynchus kisutch]